LKTDVKSEIPVYTIYFTLSHSINYKYFIHKEDTPIRQADHSLESEDTSIQKADRSIDKADTSIQKADRSLQWEDTPI